MRRNILQALLSFSLLFFLFFYGGNAVAMSGEYDMKNYIGSYNELKNNIKSGEKYIHRIDKLIESRRDNPESLAVILQKIEFQLSQLGDSKSDMQKGYILSYIVEKIKYEIWLSQLLKGTTGKGIDIYIIDDARCTNCQTANLTQQLQALPFLSNANFQTMDFSQEGTEELMKEHGIVKLPAILFSSNKLSDGENLLTPYMSQTSGGFYSLEVGASFDPYAKRSARGFLEVDQTILDEILENSYVKGRPLAKITWVEYSDFGCSFCIKMHADDKTVAKVLDAYPDLVSSRFQHMPYRNTEIPKALECIGRETGDKAFYTLLDEGFQQRATSARDIFDIAEENNIVFDTQRVEDCIDNNEMQGKIQRNMRVGQEVFGLSGTPGNVLINIETGEYEILSGAYPFESFVEVIERLQ